MKYLIKDLAKLTHLSSDRIRKWQERYKILRPERGANGYHYYSNDDLRILLYIKKQLEKGMNLKEILKKSRDEILNEILYTNDFTSEELDYIRLLLNYNYKSIEKKLNTIYKKYKFFTWSHEIHKLIILTGRAWEKNIISVSDEHAFSTWLKGYILAEINKKAEYGCSSWLVCVFPGDQHELGAILHYAKLIHFKVPAKYVGCLPREELLKEIRENNYRKVSISIVMPVKIQEIQKLKKDILKVKPVKVLFGGYGYKQFMKSLNTKLKY